MHRSDSDVLISWKRQRSLARAVVAFALGAKNLVMANFSKSNYKIYK
jgi:hypothetical protein